MKKIFLFCVMFLLCTACTPKHDIIPPAPPKAEEMPTIEPEAPTLEELALAKAQMYLAEMTLEEKVGQMFIARLPEKGALTSIETYHLGGYILFARDFAEETEETIQITTSDIQETSKIPMLLAVDEEGGNINRISKYPQYRSTPFASPQALFAEGGLQRIAEDTAEKALFLQNLGINVNFAPVCDVSENPNDYIFGRTFGQDAKKTADYVSAVVSVMKEHRMGSVLKHFPGYGNNADTHQGIAIDKRPYETFLKSDLIPFQAGINAGADCVLVSHNIVEAMDATLPASLSPAIHRIVREDLNFDGVIVTDDLYMQAIQDFTDGSEAAVLAVQAGNDLLCCTDYAVQIPAVLEAIAAGDISEETIDASVLRILIWKINLGLIA